VFGSNGLQKNGVGAKTVAVGSGSGGRSIMLIHPLRPAGIVIGLACGRKTIAFHRTSRGADAAPAEGCHSRWGFPVRTRITTSEFFLISPIWPSSTSSAEAGHECRLQTGAGRDSRR